MQREQAGPARKRAGESPAGESFRRYTEAFQSLGVRAVVQHFHEPALLIARRGDRGSQKRAAVDEASAPIMAKLPLLRSASTAFIYVEERVLGD